MINKTTMVLMAALFMVLLPVLSMAEAVYLPQTGQTTSYAVGDDGAIQAGVPWPLPRFTDNANNGTVTDNLTGLMWLKNANCFGGRTWANALNGANTLNSGECGLSDGSVEGDWRLPNVNELESLVHAGQANTATWLNTQGFTNVLAHYYWSSTTVVGGSTGYAWGVDMWNGYVFVDCEDYYSYVWPVRAGQ